MSLRHPLFALLVKPLSAVRLCSLHPGRMKATGDGAILLQVGKIAEAGATLPLAGKMAATDNGATLPQAGEIAEVGATLLRVGETAEAGAILAESDTI